MKRKTLRILILCLIIALICVGCGKKKKNATSEDASAENLNQESLMNENTINEASRVLYEKEYQFLGTWENISEEKCRIEISEMDSLYNIDIKLVENVEDTLHWFLTGEYSPEEKAIKYAGGLCEIHTNSDGSTEEKVLNSNQQGMIYFDENGYLRWSNEVEMIGTNLLFVNLNVPGSLGNGIIESIPAIIGEVVPTLPDNLYPISFYKENMRKEDGKYILTALVYNYDLYEIADVYSLTDKSIIRFKGQEVEITSVEWDETNRIVDINGGIYHDGISLMPDESGEYYRTFTDGSYPDYYCLGIADIELADDLVIMDLQADGWTPENPVNGKLPSGISNSTGDWNQINTNIQIENGKAKALVRENFK